ncbi:AAA family ATPase [Haloechinothrix halophila]|uniref:AAA family ATPase n=1 Tax=Haloechinothrix halophila TaxID=1069073 RepID=UPI000408416B|nr:LuxR family transcriptional regulator [Haloechinothrix halophila]
MTHHEGDIGPAHSLPLRGRARDLTALDEMLSHAATGRGGARVIVGGPGLGKTALLDAAARSATGFHVLRASGTPAESALPYAGLHQLLLPLGELTERIPERHRASLLPLLDPAVDVAPPDTLALHAALHALLVTAAAERPMLCCVDAAHDLDRASLDALVFTARRSDAAPLALLFTADLGGTDTAETLADVPIQHLGPVDDDAAHRILTDRIGPAIPPELTSSVLDIAEGNPLALTELATRVTPAQLSGIDPPPSTLPADSRLCRAVRLRLAELPAATALLVRLAAIDERLDVSTVDNMAMTLALDDAARIGALVVAGDTVRLANGVPRDAVLATMTAAERRQAHRLLADAAEPTDHVRWLWHRASCATAPAPALATELDTAAELARQAQRHGDAAAASERAATLSGSDADRARRLLTAAADHWASGHPHRARTALRRARPLTSHGPATTLAGEIELRSGNPAAAAADLLSTAHQLSRADTGLVATTFLLAGEASCVAGDDDRYCATALDVTRWRELHRQPATRLVLEHFVAMSATFNGHHAKAANPLHSVVRLGDEIADPTAKTLASQAAFTLGDAAATRDLALQAVACAHASGDLARVPWALVYAAMAAVLSGEHAPAITSALDGLRLAESLGQPNCVVDHLTILAMLAALRGDRETTRLRLDDAASGVVERGLGRPGSLASWAAACADLAADRPADALHRFRRMSAGPTWSFSPIRVMATPHYVEAAVRCGKQRDAANAVTHFERWANTTGGQARVALAHRCRGLLTDHPGESEEHFTEAIRLHRSAGASYDLAYTELLLASRLRRHRKPRQAREILIEAAQVFDDLDAHRWRDHARRELRACGYPVDRPSDGASSELTPQQGRIAELVAEGATNREIAATLFISHRTVDHHLRNIFERLNIRSRVELAALYR